MTVFPSIESPSPFRMGRSDQPLGRPTPIHPDSPHAVVIGAGFGGLAAAVRLLVRGYRVTVIDRLDQPGGRGARVS